MNKTSQVHSKNNVTHCIKHQKSTGGIHILYIHIDLVRTTESGSFNIYERYVNIWDKSWKTIIIEEFSWRILLHRFFFALLSNNFMPSFGKILYPIFRKNPGQTNERTVNLIKPTSKLSIRIWVHSFFIRNLITHIEFLRFFPFFSLKSFLAVSYFW